MEANETKSFVLTSNPFCYTPGVLRWMLALQKRDVKGARSDLDARKRTIRNVFPGITPGRGHRAGRGPLHRGRDG